MKRRVVLIIACAIALYSGAVAQSTPAGSAYASGKCSPAVTGNRNTFDIRCEVDPVEGKKIVDLLNRILSSEPDRNAVMSKLDQILSTVQHIQPMRHLANSLYENESRIGSVSSLSQDPVTRKIHMAATFYGIPAGDTFALNNKMIKCDFSHTHWAMAITMISADCISVGDISPDQFSIPPR